ncbi:MAG: GHKL domain-containing protein [Chloroflexi bacterium]|nr:GHKL domain-containing protein [Chloroflexota bacterium]
MDSKMILQSDSRLVSLFKSISAAASMIVLAVGVVVLIGWMFNVTLLKSILPGLVTMKANTAAAFALIGVSLWLLQTSSPPAGLPQGEWGRGGKWTRHIAHLCALFVALVGTFTLIEYLSGWNLGIDQLLFKEAPGAVQTTFPGRMAPNTALNFLITGLTLLLLDAETRRGHPPAQYLILIEGALALLALVGYVYGISTLYGGIASFTAMALHTAVVFLVVCVGVLCARPERGPMAIFTSAGLGGLIARRLFFVAVGFPIMLELAAIAGVKAGLYDPAFESAFHTLLVIIAFLFAVLATARLLDRIDAGRQRAEEAVSKLNEDLDRRAAELEAANKELEAFSYSVSHDLRAPLRAIDGFSRILIEEYAPQLVPEALRYLQLVRDNTRQMGNLVDDLLAFSRLSRQPLKVQHVEPTILVRHVLEDLRNEQEGRRIEVSIGDLPSCQADPALLKQVWVNLLSNAIKYTRKRDTARIEIGYQKTGEEQVYFVQDNGVGFDMRYAAKLFGVFQRLHRVEEYEGTGVGLAIVQRIIQRHGGRVWVEAEVDKGTIFYFTIGGEKTND